MTTIYDSFTDREQRRMTDLQRQRLHINSTDLDDKSEIHASLRTLREWLEERSDITARWNEQIAAGQHVTATWTADELATMDAKIRARFPLVDPTFRALFLGSEGRHVAEFPITTRALGATARGQIGDLPFSTTFWAAATAASPLLRYATIVNTSTGGDHHFGFTSVDVTPNGIVAEGASITVADATFANATFAAYGYKTLLKASAEMADDPAFDFERYAAERVAPVVTRDMVDDLWLGDGSDAPQGLIHSGASVTTVEAAGASAVTLDDIGKLCEEVPEEFMFGPNAVILISPGAYWDIRRQTLGTGAAGGMAVDASLPYFGGTLLGFPFAVDTGLQAPATGDISAVAGDISAAYAVRLAPLRVETDRRSAAANDQVLTRVVLRADGKPLLVGAVRALTHPA